jgi:fructose/tagatose bisphosphate aldolase
MAKLLSIMMESIEKNGYSIMNKNINHLDQLEAVLQKTNHSLDFLLLINTTK